MSRPLIDALRRLLDDIDEESARQIQATVNRDPERGERAGIERVRLIRCANSVLDRLERRIK
jgi:hypothetical protein